MDPVGRHRQRRDSPSGSRTVAFALHCHEKTSSGDSETPFEVLAEGYARRGIEVVGVVGHDTRPRIDDTGLPVNVLTGTEHELIGPPTQLHVVEFPDYDFAFLPHPRGTWGENAEENALTAAREMDLDGIEQFNRGKQQLPDLQDDEFPRLANDDAHNTSQVGVSYMSAEVAEPTPEHVVEAVKRGHAQLHNPGYSAFRHARGRLLQGLSLTRHHLF